MHSFMHPCANTRCTALCVGLLLGVLLSQVFTSIYAPASSALQPVVSPPRTTALTTCDNASRPAAEPEAAPAPVEAAPEQEAGAEAGAEHEADLALAKDIRVVSASTGRTRSARRSSDAGNASGVPDWCVWPLERCPGGCGGKGKCVMGQCVCPNAFMGPKCAESVKGFMKTPEIGYNVYKRYGYMATEPFQHRQRMIQHHLQQCDNIVEIGALLTPIYMFMAEPFAGFRPSVPSGCAGVM